VDATLKQLLKLPIRGTARRVRAFLDRDAAERDRSLQEELAQARRELEVTRGRMTEAVNGIRRGFDEVSLRFGKASRRLPQLNLDEAEFLNVATGYLGFAAQAGIWLNPTVHVSHGEGKVWIEGVNERILEVPYVFRAIGVLPPGASIVDVGASESTVALSLASLGYAVTAIDFRKYPFDHPGLNAKDGPLEACDLGDKKFDAAVVLSAIEHFGLGAYGEERGQSEADVLAMRKIRSWIKPGGHLFLTVPYGAPAVTPLHRIYDDAGLERLLQGFKVESREIGEQFDKIAWSVVPRPSKRDCFRVAMITATKSS
jgi:2-polyprenyl-3-methyl-5-hydroxy-6-metoxy-1,4-benzoquinol methylase